MTPRCNKNRECQARQLPGHFFASPRRSSWNISEYTEKGIPEPSRIAENRVDSESRNRHYNWRLPRMRTRRQRNPTFFTLFAMAVVAALMLASITGCSGESEQTTTPPANGQDELADRLERIEEALAEIQAEMDRETATSGPAPQERTPQPRASTPTASRPQQLPQGQQNQTQPRPRPRRSPSKAPASAAEAQRSRRPSWKGWAPPYAKRRPS